MTLSLGTGLVAEQRQEPRRARVTFVRAAFPQDRASGRDEPRSCRERRRQLWTARAVRPAVQDHGSLLVLEAKGELLHRGPYPRSEQMFVSGPVDGPTSSVASVAGNGTGSGAGTQATRRGALFEDPPTLVRLLARR